MARIKVSGNVFRNDGSIDFKARSAAFINAGDDTVFLDTYGVELQPGDVFSLPLSPIAEDFYEDSVAFSFLSNSNRRLQFVQYK